MDDGQRLAHAANALLGTRFRLYGRRPETGLDCVGLVSASLCAIGHQPIVPRGYRLRNSRIGSWLKCAAASGLATVEGAVEPGDVLLIQPAPGQHHLLIAFDHKYVIHAHATLRRVVREPRQAFAEPLVRWRLTSQTER